MNTFAFILMTWFCYVYGPIPVDASFVPTHCVDSTINSPLIAFGCGDDSKVHPLADGKVFVEWQNCSVCLFDPRTGRVRARLAGKHDTCVNKVRISPNNKTLVSVSLDAIVLWDLQQKAMIWRESTKSTASDATAAISFSRSSALLAYCLGDDAEGKSTVAVMDIKSVKKRSVFSVQYQVNSIAFSPDGRFLVAAGDRLTLWDCKQATIVAETPVFPRPLKQVEWGFGRTFYTVGVDGILRGWQAKLDVPLLQQVSTITVRYGTTLRYCEQWSLLVLSDDKRVYSLNPDFSRRQELFKVTCANDYVHCVVPQAGTLFAVVLSKFATCLYRIPTVGLEEQAGAKKSGTVKGR